MPAQETKSNSGSDDGQMELCNPDDFSVIVNKLDFKYPDCQKASLEQISLKLPKGRRCLLVGGNGAGKTTLLRILGGKHMHNDDQVYILGKNAHKDIRLNMERQYMDPNWGMRTVAGAGTGVAYQADIPVSQMMTQLQAEFPERRDKLYKLLKIDPEWRMHKVSDGQRRRVQLLLGLLRPFKVLLLDEVTAVLDIICRVDLLEFLKEECEERGCTIVYASHIFDGLDDWVTDLIYLRTFPHGTVGYNGALETVPIFQRYRNEGHAAPLMKVIETWLRQEEKQEEEEAAKTGQTVKLRGHEATPPPAPSIDMALSSTSAASKNRALNNPFASSKHQNYG